MSATTWRAVIRLADGRQQEIRIQADSQPAARAMIEQQYGSGALLFGPNKVDLTRW